MKAVYKALSDFQAEVPIIFKTTTGYNYKYADLPSVLNIVKPLLQKHGLVFTQLVNQDCLQTTLFHLESGEQIESCSPFIQGVKLGTQNEIQSLGSQITYLRRYALGAMLGLVTEEDNDAHGEQKKKKEKKKHIKDVEGAYEKARISLAKGDVTVEQIKKKYDISGVDFRLEELL